jgi:hypothetical protein
METGLCRSAEVKGNLVPDAYLAALAIESGSERVTTDRDFSRFPGLRSGATRSTDHSPRNSLSRRPRRRAGRPVRCSPASLEAARRRAVLTPSQRRGSGSQGRER